MSRKRVASGRPARLPRTDERPKNSLLAALPARDFRRLLPHLTTIPVRVRQVLHRQGELIREVYFPNGGVWSVTTLLSSGQMVEVATIGDEGMIGLEAFLVMEAVAAGETQMQVPDTDAVMLNVEVFRREVALRGALHEAMGRYALGVMAQMMQTTACNALHHVQQRCARWLLMTHDRMHEQDFTLSHEFLAVMVGAQRPTVSAAAATLQDAGFIRYRHGHVTVRDRKGLEGASCECYPVIRGHFDRLRSEGTRLRGLTVM